MTELWLYILIALLLFREDPLLGLLSVLLWIILQLLLRKKPEKKLKKKLDVNYDMAHALDAARNTRLYTFY